MSNTIHPIIRVSTDRQLTGHGLESQHRAITDWISRHPEYELGESLELDGYSAFKGQHVDKLKSFVASLPVGSTILLTEISRLSRLPIRQSYDLLYWILDRGVNVGFVTLDQVLTNSELDDSLYLRLSILFQNAKSESEMKSFRIRNVFADRIKRIEAGQHVKTTGLPAWIEVIDNAYHVDEYHAETLKLMFEEKLKAGSYAVTNYLIENRKPFPRLKRWSNSRVQAILKSRAVLGDYQPYTTFVEDGKERRKPLTPIPDVYPCVIDESLFVQVQQSFRTQPAGRKAKHSPNPLAGTYVCPECKGSTSINRTSNRAYYRCENARDKRGCTAKSIRQEIVLDAVNELIATVDLSRVLKPTRSQDSIQEEIDAVSQKITNLVHLVASGMDLPEVTNQLQQLQQQRDSLNQVLLNYRIEDVPDFTKVDRGDPVAFHSALRKLFAWITVEKEAQYVSPNPLTGEEEEHTDNLIHFKLLDISENTTPVVTIPISQMIFAKDVVNMILNAYLPLRD